MLFGVQLPGPAVQLGGAEIHHGLKMSNKRKADHTLDDLNDLNVVMPHKKRRRISKVSKKIHFQYSKNENVITNLNCSEMVFQNERDVIIVENMLVRANGRLIDVVVILKKIKV